MNRDLIDIHCHILPGVDDGADSVAESILMAELARQDGVTCIFATPHIREGNYRDSLVAAEAAMGSIRDRISAVTLLGGGEVRISYDIYEMIDLGCLPTLGGSPYLLVELSPYSLPPGLSHLMLELINRGIVPVVAHPERYEALVQNREVVKQWQRVGALFQITSRCITGQCGKPQRKAALGFIKDGLADFVASDGHSPRSRAPILSEALEIVMKEFGASVVDRLFYSNPEGVLKLARVPV